MNSIHLYTYMYITQGDKLITCTGVQDTCNGLDTCSLQAIDLTTLYKLQMINDGGMISKQITAIQSLKKTECQS